MVSSYLVCDLCGRFGPPASIFSADGLRLCYSCWYEAQRNLASPAADPGDLDLNRNPVSEPGESDPATPDRQRRS